MSAVLLHGGIRGITLPPLHSGVKGLIGKAVTTDAEIDQLRIDAVRRCEGVIADLARLKDRPATLADVLAGADRLRELLVASVPFESAEIVERAADKLVRAIGEDGTVADPRPEYIGSVLSMGNVREMVAGMVELIEPYRKMLAQMKAGKP